MKKTENMVWRFFASVKLALVTLLILASTSIIGTLIPQKNPPEFYIQNFGAKTAQFFQLLDVPDMYNSWWFIALLLLFSINLIVCTIDRLPNVWQMVVMDNLNTPIDRLEKMPNRRVFLANNPQDGVVRTITAQLKEGGWACQMEEKESGILLFSQKGAWSRLGVYAVHLSILFIFAGAIIGSAGGFKGSVMIPEGAAIDTVYAFGSEKPIPLGFTVTCDQFSVSYYDDGQTPKEYRSVLTVKDAAANKTITRPIIVNDPLDYKGITFYQSSYQPMQGFGVTITNKTSKASQSFQIPFAQKISWPGTAIEFGLINQQPRSRMGDVSQVKFWFSDGQGEPSVFWMADKATQSISRQDDEYEISVRQLYATGLQVAKDPGVWVVYFGCTLMLVGLYVAFFLSHRRVWVYIGQEADKTRVLLCGASSKNKLGFDKDFAALTERFEKIEDFQNA
ncbi:cytochrome c biogenesis protein ResB [Thiovibrio sp. JS02]